MIVLQSFAVAGLGNVGLADAALQSQRHRVPVFDVSGTRVVTVARRQSPIVDPELQQMLSDPDSQITVTSAVSYSYADADEVRQRQLPPKLHSRVIPHF